MTDSPYFSVRYFTVRHAAVAALLLGLCIGIFASGSSRPPKPTGDDWRRTSRGWERVSAWSTTTRTSNLSNIAAYHPSVHQRRISNRTRSDIYRDTHPAALALLQLITSLLALAIFSPRGRALLSETPLPALLTRSFRASVFGS